MAFPYIYEASFDTGDNSEWTSESDCGSTLDFPHYSTLAAGPNFPAPYRGAYCMRITMDSGAEDHTLTADGIDVALAATRWLRFAMYLSTDFAVDADDAINIFEFQQSGGTVEGSLGFNVTADTDAVAIGFGDGTAPSAYPGTITKGEWHVIEISYTASDTGAGAAVLYVDGAAIQTLSSLENAGAIGQGVLGIQDQLHTSKTGYILFDEVAFDDTRIGVTDRFHTHRMITTSSFLFVGPGRIDNVKILDGGSGDVTLELYDTDVYSSSLTPVWYDRTASNNVNVDAAEVPIEFRHGCLAILGGTTPGASFKIGRAVGYGSDGAVLGYGMRRKSRAI